MTWLAAAWLAGWLAGEDKEIKWYSIASGSFCCSRRRVYSQPVTKSFKEQRDGGGGGGRREWLNKKFKLGNKTTEPEHSNGSGLAGWLAGWNVQESPPWDTNTSGYKKLMHSPSDGWPSEWDNKQTGLRTTWWNSATGGHSCLKLLFLLFIWKWT